MKKFFVVLAMLALVGGADVAYGQANNTPYSGSQSAPIPQNLVVKILQEARDYFGMSLGQMIQAYRSGDCTIQWMQTNPPSMTFRVTYGGNHINIIIEDNA